jgi:hypothetical protein
MLECTCPEIDLTGTLQSDNIKFASVCKIVFEIYRYLIHTEIWLRSVVNSFGIRIMWDALCRR